MPRISEAAVETRREAILVASARVFARDGIEGASLRRIAAEAGVTTGAIYPHFGGKEDIYATLLHRSLLGLYRAVSDAAPPGTAPEQALRQAARAFAGYYARHRFELDLGLYTFRGLARHSLGRERDRVLNDCLLRVLGVLAQAIGALGGRRADVEAERNALFAYLIGTLTLERTGRTRPIGASPAALLEHYLDALVARLQGATTKGGDR